MVLLNSLVEKWKNSFTFSGTLCTESLRGVKGVHVLIYLCWHEQSNTQNDWATIMRQQPQDTGSVFNSEVCCKYKCLCITALCVSRGNPCYRPSAFCTTKTISSGAEDELSSVIHSKQYNATILVVIVFWLTVCALSSVSPDVASDQNHHRHHPPAVDSELKGRSRSLGLIATIWVFILPCLHILLVL